MSARAIGARLGLGLLLVAGCSSDATSPDGQGDGSAFDITISNGVTPTYTWPGGPAHSVSIMRVSAPTTIVWGVAHPQQALPSPVTHGTTSNGALTTMATEARLTAGVRYRVSITRQDTRTGWKEFTP
ncbi:MAG: hypothetical protein ACXWZS_13995 [Gemmatirosa sp.]